ncbi:MAG: membrane dipeptidase [Acidobacteria bacterium]|nr:membrane dipeptidase [Acidobacteriota bacterium]MCW5949265.1 membrane dipeptidase [Pyrinomonadaceae bacterium]
MKRTTQIHAMVIAAIITLLTLAGQASAKDINGYYYCNDGSSFFLRQVGTKLYGFGENSDGSFASVLAGTINGTKVEAKWWDVPKGRAKTSGTITFEISFSGDMLKKVTSSVPNAIDFLKFAPITRDTTEKLRSKPEGFSGGTGNLTGVWNGDDFASYYVREMPEGDVVFYAENNLWGDPGGEFKPSFARVFIGKKVNALVTGDWVDLPKGKAGASGVLASRIVNPQEITFNNPPVGIDGTRMYRSLPNNLFGWADLHTHPMAHLALGRKFIHGVPDVGSLIPADENCRMNYRAEKIEQALDKDNSTHGGTDILGLGNRCGDNFRASILDSFQSANGAEVTPNFAAGYPTFKDYPKYNDLTHQKMWIDWVRRAYHGGQRVMIGLAMNNQTLASAVSGPGDGPVSDKESADLQIDEMKLFAKRHNDFMEIAYSAADVRRIVAANKMALILGVEIDNIGNFINFRRNLPNSATREYEDNTTEAATFAEIDRLYAKGVRYVFPVHLIDSLYGGTAIYQDLFNLSNYHIRHKYWDVRCSQPGDGITKKFKVAGFDAGLAAAKALKLGIDIANFPPDPPKCDKVGEGSGHVNGTGLSPLGESLIRKLVAKGMLIDIDHSSVKTIDAILKIAEAVPGGYPLVSGHTGLRTELKNENSRTPAQLAKIAQLGGMFGLGSDDVTTGAWINQYIAASKQMGAASAGRVAFGSDLNGLVKGPSPFMTLPTAITLDPIKLTQAAKVCTDKLYVGGFIKSRTGQRSWDACTDGVAHYGMLTDFLQQIRSMPQGNVVNADIMRNAEAFALMWAKAEKAKGF